MLEISQSEVAESLHAKFYLYERNYQPSGVSVHTLSVEDTPEESIFFGTIILMKFQDIIFPIGNALDVLGFT